MASKRKRRWNPKYWSKYGVPTTAPEGLMGTWLKMPENKRKAEFQRRKEEWRKKEFEQRKEVWRKEEFQKRKLEHNKKELEKRVEVQKEIKVQKSVDKYDNMSYDELKQKAKSKGIKSYWRKKKEELIAELDFLIKKPDDAL